MYETDSDYCCETMIEGVRVVRGPDWSDGDEDGGEGHVGTVTQDNEDGTVEVQWDMGNEGMCSTGKDGKCDIRVLDSTTVGLKHDGVICDGCMKSAFTGTRWRCTSCPDFDLCGYCYFGNKHSLQDQFKRIDAPGFTGVNVPDRSSSRRIQAQGIFQNARVKRGVDWNCGNQDGGEGTIGVVSGIKNHGTDGRENDAAMVDWPNQGSNSYRLGFRGKVDLECVRAADGPRYYPDHLLALNTTQQDTQQPPEVPRRISVRRPKVPPRDGVQKGDRVCAYLPEAAFKEAQRGHGGWSMRMKDYIGKPGTVESFTDSGDCVVDYGEKKWTFNPDAVKKIETIKVGDIVRVMENKDKVIELQKRQGWQPEMEQVLGKAGKVVKIDSDGDIAVSFGNKAWVFNPVVLELAPGAQVFQLAEKKEPGGRGAAGGGARGGDDPGDLLGHLIANMLLMKAAGELQAARSAQALLAAASNNELGKVEAILKVNPQLVNEKYKGLTALIISSHEGYLAVVKVLLDKGADRDLTDEKGNTALMAALMKNREAVAMELIDKGANIHLANRSDRTALHFAAANGSNNILKELLRRKADPNKRDAVGDTPLHDAVFNKNTSGVAILLADERTSQKLLNNKGLCPLHLAAMKDDDISVERLLSKVPRLLNAVKGDGYTALHIAAVNDNVSVVKVLIKHKADLSKENKQGLTPLHLACHQGYINTAHLLIEAGANIKATDTDGDTPLHLALMGSRSGGQEQELLAQLFLGIRTQDDSETKDRANLACLLIKNGASVLANNHRGKTPLQCCSNGRMRNAVAEFAKKHSPSPTSGGATGSTGSGQPRTLADLFSDLPLPCGGCMQRVADTTFIPCGHRVCCKHCSFRVRECPLCDRVILRRLDQDGNQLVIADPCKVQ